jgi:hypothetical protein
LGFDVSTGSTDESEGRRTSALLIWPLTAVIGASTAYHIALAAGWLNYSARGAPPPGHQLVPAGFVSLLLSPILLMAASLVSKLLEGDPPTSGLWTRRAVDGLLVAGIALVVARYYAPDTYYLNQDERIADHYPGGRIVGLVLLAAVGIAIGRRWPRTKAPVTAALMVLCAVVMGGEGYGH